VPTCPFHSVASSARALLQGAQLIFERFIVPFMHKYASQIDPAFHKAEQVSFCGDFCRPCAVAGSHSHRG
jgi:hypothetical protein